MAEHPRARINYDPSHFLLQAMDYLAFIDIYHDRISAFHVKDAEFRPDGRQGVYSGYSRWNGRGVSGSLGDGQVDFPAVFTRLTPARLSRLGGDGMECFLKSPAQGAAEGAPFIARHLIEVTGQAFDDFAAAGGPIRRCWTQCWGSGHDTETGYGRRRTRGLHRRGPPHGRKAGWAVELVAGGAVLLDPARAAASAADLGIAPDRSYSDFAQMALAEAACPDGIAAVAIVTPNHLHAKVATAFLRAGIAVICDKPMTATLPEAEELAALAAETSVPFLC